MSASQTDPPPRPPDGATPAAGPERPPNPPRRPLVDGLVVWSVTFVGLAIVGLLRAFVPFVAANVLAFVAVLFLYLPLALLWRRREEPADLGITTRGWPRDLGVAALTMLVVFPPFVLGYHLWHGAVLGQEPDFAVERLARWDPPLDGKPLALDDSAAVHVWAAGERVVVAGGGALATPQDVTLVADAPCDAVTGAVRGGRCPTRELTCVATPGGGCVVRAPAWTVLTLRAPAVEALSLGELADRAAPPVEAESGFGWWLTFVLVQLGLVALPEEVLYRGYIQSRLDQRWRPRWRFLGATIGPSVFVTSALFAVGHLAIDPGPHRLAVFFPALLFGWLRARTGTVVAPIVVHGASNVLIRVVASFYYF